MNSQYQFPYILLISGILLLKLDHWFLYLVLRYKYNPGAVLWKGNNLVVGNIFSINYFYSLYILNDLRGGIKVGLLIFLNGSIEKQRVM